MVELVPWPGQRESVFRDRYAAPGEDTPEQMWTRVANGLTPDDPAAALDSYDIMSDWRFVPAGRILSASGRGGARSLYNCRVLGPDNADGRGRDSRGSIMRLITRGMECTARGEGVGINWSHLRPAGTPVRGVGADSEGPVAWMTGADAVMSAIRQGGSRTAALMFVIDDTHPDVARFANASFAHANHSVAVSDAFMHAAEHRHDWRLRFPDTTHPDYDARWRGRLGDWEDAGLPVIEHGVRPADELLREFSRCAAATGNPGLVFLERANRGSRLVGRPLVATNPCGEVPLYEDGTCNLGAVNLLAHARPINDIQWAYDPDAIGRAAAGGVRLLNRVIDAAVGFDRELSRTQRDTRRIGIGVMGLADLLLLMRLRYGSLEALQVTEHVFRIVLTAAALESARLAALDGRAPAWTRDHANAGPLGRLDGRYDHITHAVRAAGQRNCFLTAQAPTGTTSILAGASSGIEPIFAAEYTRRDATGEHTVRHPLFPRADGIRQPWAVTAHDLTPDDHLNTQAAAQRWCDSGISKTVNMPAGSDGAAVMDIYQKAWRAEVVGITVFVDGSRPGVLTPDCPTGVCDI